MNAIIELIVDPNMWFVFDDFTAKPIFECENPEVCAGECQIPKRTPPFRLSII